MHLYIWEISNGKESRSNNVNKHVKEKKGAGRMVEYKDERLGGEVVCFNRKLTMVL